MLSFIVPVFKPNYELFKKCLTSLKKQSFKDWEAIVVLDGPDSMAESIVGEVADKRIKLVQKAHEGVQKARNEGFKHTKGEIVSFWDCDCLIEPDTAKTWINAFDENPKISFVYSGYKFIGENGGIASEPFDPWTLRVGNYISTMFPMRREVFPGFDETLESLQDWDMWLTVVENGGKGMFIPGYAFSTAYPTEDSISGKGCTNDAWLGRVNAVKVKHNLPERSVCVSSLGHREEGIRLAKLIDADYKDVPNFKPNKYSTIVQVGFSLSPNKVRQHSSIFNQALKKKVIFWTAEDVAEVNNAISLKALTTYSAYLNPQTIQFCEDLSAKTTLERAGFNVNVLPMPMVNTDKIESLPETPRIMVDITEDYRQIMGALTYSLPDFTFDFLTEAKEIKDYSAILSLNAEKTTPFTVKRMLLTGRNVISNQQNPFCGYVNDNQEPGKYISDLVDAIRKRAGRDTKPSVDYWAKQMGREKLMEVIK
jgi:glycosyltransferase involved in cell wall biosynthesis